MAEQMSIVKSAEPIVRSAGTHNAVDVQGIAPGMSVDEAKKRLVEIYGKDPSVWETTLSVQNKSVYMDSQPYVARMRGEKDSDYIDVYFGTPSTGNVVVGIERKIQYLDARSAPEIATTIKALQDKYGPVSSVNPQYAKQTFLWFHKKDGLSKCEWRVSCDNTEPVLDPSQLEYLMKATKNGSDLAVFAFIDNSDNDKSRLYSMMVKVSDLTNKALTLDEAFKQMNAAAEAAYNSSSPAKAPDL